MTNLESNIKEYNNQTFYDLDLSNQTLEEMYFTQVQFKNCHFSQTKLIKCKFKECEFIQCDLSMTTVNACVFSETIFSDSKLLGINWTTVRWPQIKLMSPVCFYRCNLSHSSFFEMSLIEIVIESCKAENVDFRGADLSSANLTETDFSQSLFQHTKLKHADFTDSFNYSIDPTQNDIKKAKFSFPEVVNLLRCFDIEIANIE